jgi:hypothetical protein
VAKILGFPVKNGRASKNRLNDSHFIFLNTPIFNGPRTVIFA